MQLMKKYGKYIVLIGILLLLQSCNKELAYEAVRSNQKFECQKLPPPQYDECMERLGDSYDEYNKKREELNVDK